MTTAEEHAMISSIETVQLRIPRVMLLVHCTCTGQSDEAKMRASTFVQE